MSALHELLQNTPTFFIGLSLLLGLVVGSFLNVVIYRLPKMLELSWQQQCAELRDETAAPSQPFNLLTPRSACPQCGEPIAAWHNIPLLSYLLLGGKCAHCSARISLRYPLVELASGLLCAFAAAHFGYAWTAVGAMLLIWFLLALTVIDLNTQLLPDDLTLPLLWLGLLFNLFGVFVPLSDAVIGAIAGYLALWSVYWGFRLITGKEGMGYGDFKLLAALGAWFGWQGLIPIILMASVIGAIIGIVLKFNQGLREGGYVPFGPFLAGAGLTAMIFGPQAILAAVGL